MTLNQKNPKVPKKLNETYGDLLKIINDQLYSPSFPTLRSDFLTQDDLLPREKAQNFLKECEKRGAVYISPAYFDERTNDLSCVGLIPGVKVRIAIVMADGVPQLFILFHNIEESKKQIKRMGYVLIIYYNVSFPDSGSIEYAVGETIMTPNMETLGFIWELFVRLIDFDTLANFDLINNLLEAQLEYFCENPGPITSRMCHDFVIKTCRSQDQLPGYSMVLAIASKICNIDIKTVWEEINRDTDELLNQYIPEWSQLIGLRISAIEHYNSSFIDLPTKFIPSDDLDPLFGLPENEAEEFFEQYIRAKFSEPINEKLPKIKNFKCVAFSFLSNAENSS